LVREPPLRCERQANTDPVAAGVAEKRKVALAAPDGTQLIGIVGGRANAVTGDGDSCDMVVSLVG
jgi:hypothetical protein